MNLKLFEKLSEDTSNVKPATGKEGHVGCRVTNSLLKYLESLEYDTDSIVEGLPYSKEYLSDPFNWIPFSVRDELQNRAAQLVGDEKIMYKVGLSTPKLSSIGGIEHMVQLVGSPKQAYRSVPRYASLFDRITKFETNIIDDCKAIVTMSMLEGYSVSKHACYYAQGMLAAIPTLWGLPPADVHEKQCMCKNHSEDKTGIVKRNAEKCIYEVTWQPLPPLHSRLGDKLFRRNCSASVALNKLEGNFRLLDQKNAELIRRNSQLAKVREIALSIDSARTTDDLLKLVVEAAREIPGVRFVLVFKVDEETQQVMTPYYSRIRNKGVIKTLKSIGFNPDKQLGKNPTDCKLMFEVAKLKIAQDYVSNPRTIINDQLSQVLDGVWPKLICDSIQRVLNVNRFVLVPLMV